MLSARDKLAARRECEKQDRERNYTGPTGGFKKGLCVQLGKNVFDCGHYSSIAQMEHTWKNLKLYVGMNYGKDICEELQSMEYTELHAPRLPEETHDRHDAKVKALVEKEEQARIIEIQTLKNKAQSGKDNDALTELALAKNRFAETKEKSQTTSPIALSDIEKIIYAAEWRSYMERQASLDLDRGRVYCLMLGQCSERLQDRLKQDRDWSHLSRSYDPVELYHAISTAVYRIEHLVPDKTPTKNDAAYKKQYENDAASKKQYENDAACKKQYDKQFWRDKKCFKCNKLGHPASACINDDHANKSQSGEAESKVHQEMATKPNVQENEMQERPSKRVKEETQN